MNPKRRRRLIEQFRDEEYRTAYADSVLDSTIAAQIKANREARNWTQEELAKRAGIKQSRISIMENFNYWSWSISALKRLARSFGLRLVVRFESFSSLFSGIQTNGELESRDAELLVRPGFEEDQGLRQISRPTAPLEGDLVEPNGRYCVWCRRPLEGRQEKWCDDGCKRSAFNASKAPELLACLSQRDFRAAIKTACEKRWPRGGRLKLRFGRYHPNK